MLWFIAIIFRLLQNADDMKKKWYVKLSDRAALKTSWRTY